MSTHILKTKKHSRTPKVFFLDFLKIYNKLGKVKNFFTSRPLFSCTCVHPISIRVKSAFCVFHFPYCKSIVGFLRLRLDMK